MMVLCLAEAVGARGSSGTSVVVTVPGSAPSLATDAHTAGGEGLGEGCVVAGSGHDVDLDRRGLSRDLVLARVGVKLDGVDEVVWVHGHD
jgi:hypothetical protein